VNGGMTAWPKFIGLVDGLLAGLRDSPVVIGESSLEAG
jgi:hypothetical protein